MRLMIAVFTSCNRHAWTETQTTNLSDPQSQLTFRYVKCLGHLRCMKADCPHISRTKEFNDIYWERTSPEVLLPGTDHITPAKCTVVCRFCKTMPICLKLCSCKMFYIIPKNYNMSKATVHLGRHDHPVTDGDCREALDLIRTQIYAQVAKTPNAKTSAIGLAVGK
jgi:hypothetical protein